MKPGTGERPVCLWYNENVIAVGAQIERRGDAWPARGLLGGKDLAGRFVDPACQPEVWLLDLRQAGKRWKA
jgi:hypothetical protein